MFAPGPVAAAAELVESNNRAMTLADVRPAHLRDFVE
jgi:hypothetical protein